MNTLQKVAGGIVVGILCGAALVGYTLSHTPTRSFAPFVGVTRIKVYDLQGSVTVIRSPSRIARLCAFVNRFPSDWGGSEDIFGVPIPSVKADFFAGPVFLGHFGAGTRFFETQRDGDFASRSASAAEVSAFRSLAGNTQP